MSKSNILIILPFFTLGGAETQAFNLAKGLKIKGFNVTVIAFEEKNKKLILKLEEAEISWDVAKLDLSIVHSKSKFKFIQLIKFIFYLRSYKPDYLFPFTYYPNIICSSIWRFTGAKNCYWNQRGMEKIGKNFIEKLAIWQKPKYISNSISGANFISNRHKIDQNKVQVISNGLNVKPAYLSQEDWRKKLNIQPDEKIVTQVANFYPEKNHLYLIQAWKLFTQKYLNYKLVLVGYAPNEIHLNKAKALVYDLGLNNVIFLNSENDISGLLSVANIGILVSSSEGCPNTILEYMHAKVPVIASDISPVKEVLGTNYPYLVDLNNTKDLKDKLDEMVNQTNFDDLFQSYDSILHTKYTNEKMIKAYLKLVSNEFN